MQSIPQAPCQKLISVYFQSVAFSCLVLERFHPQFGRRFRANPSSIPDKDQDNRHNQLFQCINLRRRKTTHDPGAKANRLLKSVARMASCKAHGAQKPERT
jgi:hypothetical protein